MQEEDGLLKEAEEEMTFETLFLDVAPHGAILFISHDGKVFTVNSPSPLDGAGTGETLLEALVDFQVNYFERLLVGKVGEINWGFNSDFKLNWIDEITKRRKS